jgi:23S rRNA pseudouridine1911/1915/1917 synthase
MGVMMDDFIVPESLDGSRLDRAIAAMLPGMGVRAARRLFDQTPILVDGAPRPKGFMVSAGQLVHILREDRVPGEGGEGVRLVAGSGPISAVFKPAGVHTEGISGTPGSALEHFLDPLFPGEKPMLLNRLDRDTSGLVLVALNDQGKAMWSRNQDLGMIHKEYLLMAEGILEDSLVIKNEIDSADRRTVRVLKGREADRLRWTRVEPLDAVIGFEEHTICLAMILKGGRHQVRAHMAFAGHPVVGDAQYGQGGRERLYLHHFRVSMPGFSAMAWPDWPEECLPGELKERILEEFPLPM